MRILFAFDPKRRAIMLLAGDKAGNWKKWYRVNIPIAHRKLDRHWAWMKERGSDGKQTG